MVVSKQQLNGRQLPPCAISMGLLLLIASCVPLSVNSLQERTILEVGDNDACEEGQYRPAQTADSAADKTPTPTALLIETNVCVPCNNTCKTCEDITAKCLSCEKGKFESDDKCEDCEEPCSTCHTSASTCTGCIKDYKLRKTRCYEGDELAESKTEKDDTTARGRASFRLKMLMFFIAATSVLIIGYAVYTLSMHAGDDEE